MFISNKYKLVFLEVPRTGSHSITEALTQLDPEAPTVMQRQVGGPYVDYHRFRCDEMDDPAYRVIATHRNPYERLWSHWKYRHRTGNPDLFKIMSWRTYVDWTCDPAILPELSVAMRECPIAEMFDLCRVDFWLDFTDLAGSWAVIAQKLNIPLPPLSVLNSSTDYGDVSIAYTESIARRVQDRFARDFDFFRYQADSWKIPLDNKSEVVESPDERLADAVVPAKRRVAILTAFSRPSSAYSLQRVVQDQLAMLVKNGYEPMLLVAESEFWGDAEGYFAHERVRMVQYPAVKWINQEGEEEVFVQDLERLTVALKEALSDIDVVLSHDIIYMPHFLKLSIAARHVSRELPHVRWLQWIHSATTPEILNKQGLSELLYDDVLSQEWPGSYPVFFTRMSVPRISRNFFQQEADVKIIPNAANICEFLGLSPVVTRLYEDKRLHMADYISIVPTRLDRGKQVEWVIRILARLKAMGACVRVVVMDFHSQAGDKNRYRNDLKALAIEWGLDSEELTFLSDFDQSLEKEAPHSMVKELFSLSNLYIQPSRSEGYSLTTQEAAICGNLLVLNDDFPPVREIFGEQALYCQFSSNIDRIQLLDGDTELQIEPLQLNHKPHNYPDCQLSHREGFWYVDGEAAHANAIANRIHYEFSNNIVLKQRQIRMRDRNIFAVFNRYIEPLIETVCSS
jgi:hypothetical protein